jgi:hypothetical protein
VFARKPTFIASTAEGTRPDTSEQRYELASRDNLGGLGPGSSTSATVAG